MMEQRLDSIPLREGIDQLITPAVHEDGDQTTDEEPELQKRRRPPRGSGWWGAGQPVSTTRKGLARPMVDGGGLCSPGRWPPGRRRLPGGIADRARTAAVTAFENSVRKATGGKKDALDFMMLLATGALKENPFA